MVTTYTWASPESEATALSSGLDALGSGSFAVSSAIDNETDLYQYIDLEVSLASFTPGSGLPYIAVYAVYSLDGTNFEKEPDGSSGDKSPLAIFPLEASVAQASRVMVVNIPIAPLQFKLSLYNGSGAALAANSSTLKYSRHNMQST